MENKDIYWIDEIATFAKFGYYSYNLKPQSSKKVIGFCSECKIERIGSKQTIIASFLCHKCSYNKKPKYLLKNKRGISSIISISKTIKKFGYDPRYLTPKSNRKIIYICKICKKEIETFMYNTLDYTGICKNCITKIEEQKKKISAGLKDFYKNNINPCIGKIISKEICKKMSISRIGKCKGKNNPNYGKISHGKGSWYIKKDGSKVWMRSSYETKFAKNLDEKDTSWQFEFKTFPINYIYEGQEKEGTYTPDFLIEDSGEFIEVKGWWRDDAEAKFLAFKAQYPEVHISLYMKKELQNLGVL